MGNQRSVVTHPSRANSWGALTPWRTRLRCACVGEWPHWACVTLFTLIGSVLWNWSINQWKKYIIISTNHEGPEAFQISLFQKMSCCESCLFHYFIGITSFYENSSRAVDFFMLTAFYLMWWSVWRATETVFTERAREFGGVQGVIWCAPLSPSRHA